MVKTNSIRYLLQRNLKNCDRDIKLSAYKVYIRPVIEYASAIWDISSNQGLNYLVESVQRKAVRWIFDRWTYKSSPTEMILKLKLKTLEERRQIAKVKLLHSFYHQSKYIENNVMAQRARNVNIRFKPIYGRVNVYKHSFLPSTVALWNKLPSNLVNIECPKKFAVMCENIDFVNLN